MVTFDTVIAVTATFMINTVISTTIITAITIIAFTATAIIDTVINVTLSTM